MDITFHYFAVKTLALEAGFPGAEAQRLAAFSQFVDDFDRRGLGTARSQARSCLRRAPRCSLGGAPDAPRSCA